MKAFIKSLIYRLKIAIFAILQYMSAHMRKHPIKKHANDIISMHHAGVLYHFPKKVAERYSVIDSSIDEKDVFSRLNKKYTKAGALLRGIRIRESLTQAEMANQIAVTQSDISQMEHGTRKIGRKVAQRIEKLFDIDYRSFLE